MRTIYVCEDSLTGIFSGIYEVWKRKMTAEEAGLEAVSYTHLSTFLLELPPYRRPQIGKVIIRSVLDRTLFVLGRAIIAAAPAGLLIWCAANITVGDQTILMHCAGFLDPCLLYTSRCV